MKRYDFDALRAKRPAGFFDVARFDKAAIGDKKRAAESQLARHLAEAIYRAFPEYHSCVRIEIE
jgi:hypothetical protein